MAASVPQDTDDTRRAHLAGLVRHPVTLSLGITLAIAALVGATLATDTHPDRRRRRRRGRSCSCC